MFDPLQSNIVEYFGIYSLNVFLVSCRVFSNEFCLEILRERISWQDGVVQGVLGWSLYSAMHNVSFF